MGSERDAGAGGPAASLEGILYSLARGLAPRASGAEQFPKNRVEPCAARGLWPGGAVSAPFRRVFPRLSPR
jgi:hypothetical protein